ncbi:MAG: SMC-Scp complex subunit ScpB [Nitrospirota bacterium]
MDDREIKSILETFLFLSEEPLEPDKIKGLLDGVASEKIKDFFKELKREYDDRKGGLQIAEIAGGYQILTKTEFAPWVKKFNLVRLSSRLSKAAVETLAIIAYKQPLIRSEIEVIRGVNIEGILKNLLERRLIRIIGRRDIPGRPLMYGTTKEFLQYFGLKELSELPTLKEFKETEVIADQGVPELPLEGLEGPEQGVLEEEIHEGD